MEAKFFSEIEKNMDIKTLKDFEKEIRIKINDSLRLSGIKMQIFQEC